MKKITVNDKTNDQVRSVMNEFPDFALRCKLGDVMKDRGLSISELSDLTGIRKATLSEMINMKRTTINVLHLVTIAATLRIADISELFAFVYDDRTIERFEGDKPAISNYGVTESQEIYLAELRKIRKEQKEAPLT